MKTCIVAALENELIRIKNDLDAQFCHNIGGLPCYIAHLDDKLIYLAVIGVGLVSAAISLGSLITTMRLDQVIMTGSAGALPGSRLEIGNVAVATSESLAELGICAGEGLGECNSLNLPGVTQTISLSEDLTNHITNTGDVALKIRRGAFLSVAGVSNNQTHASTRAKSFGAIVENMEGYALAFAGIKFGIDVAEVRGVSNFAGIRDKSVWDLGLANERAQSVVLNHLRRRS